MDMCGYIQIRMIYILYICLINNNSIKYIFCTTQTHIYNKFLGKKRKLDKNLWVGIKETKKIKLEMDITKVLQWLNGDIFLKTNENNKDNGKKMFKMVHYRNNRVEKRRILEKQSCTWCLKAVYQGKIKGFDGFLVCTMCYKSGCCKHFTSKFEGNVCFRCGYKGSKVKKWNSKVKQGKWFDYYKIKDKIYGLYTLNNKCCWYSGISRNIERTIDKYQITVENKWKKMHKCIKKGINNYKPKIFEKLLKKNYDEKYKNSPNKLNVTLYLDKKVLGKSSKFEIIDDYKDSYKWSKHILFLDGWVDYGMKQVSSVLHDSVRARALEWSSYMCHCIKRDGLKNYKIPNWSTLYNHSMAFEGFYNYSNNDTVLLYNEINPDNIQNSKQYRKIMLGWYFQTRVCLCLLFIHHN